MTSVSLGLLLPTSSILPISKDVERGIKEGFAQNTSNITLSIVKEFIGQGGVKQTEEAVSRFFNYHDVDVVSGVVSQKVADEVAEQFKKKKMPFIVNDLGAHIPRVEHLNEYTYINSLHLWQHAWAIGKWGVETFGKKGMYVSAVYDSGYSFSQMFHEGMVAADANADWSFSVCPMPPAGQLSDVSVVFPFMEQYQPDFIFATFCGAETTLFLKECIARGWHKRTAIIGLPFLMEPLEALPEDITLYSSIASLNDDMIAPVRSFYQLGYETGAVLAKAAAAGGDLNRQLAQHFTGLRKGDSEETLAADSSYEIVMLRSTIKAGTQEKEVAVVDTLPSFVMEYQQMQSLVSEINFGWTNPYLCV
ncbi:hypothetical protein HNQ91_003365 [Filimonas zeae]|uniref:Leucine-binding protein domain-containing protein n=1 Tax=Filimonas zeae TaxID=1737353 RepID=A0A917J117_9BACT|nr:ABC transporter substrate-binding protein [Filimonas zeae]MDR6340300.1 hypothetical protein [Filimonas zeae]GGH72083.1 hypothetical protein GCM10011379_32130 [Filimonas zeae]